MALRVSAIRIYPVKGLRGLSVTDAVVEPWGLAGDRRFMVVDPAGRFLSQRDLPRMAVIDAVPESGGVTLSAEGAGRVTVGEPGLEADAVTTTLFRDVVPARDTGGDAARWLSAALGLSCRLVHMAEPATARPVDPTFAAPADRVSFADGFPLLATNAASLDDLNARLAWPVSMDRFRTNVVVEGAAAWAEDDWTRLAIGDVLFTVPKDCARCAVPTVDQETGVKAEDSEPIRTLARFRRKAGGRIIFGQNLIPQTLGRIAVGDVVGVT